MNGSAWFVDTIYRSTLTGTDAYGDPSYSAPAEVKCRFEYKSDVVRNADGEEVAVAYQFLTATAINESDIIWPPGVSSSDAGDGYMPITIERASTKPGSYTLYKVTL